MNWRDSIRASDNRHAQGRSQSVLAYAALSEPMKENTGSRAASARLALKHAAQTGLMKR